MIALLSPHNYRGVILEGVVYDETLRRSVFTAVPITLPSALNNWNYISVHLPVIPQTCSLMELN